MRRISIASTFSRTYFYSRIKLSLLILLNRSYNNNTIFFIFVLLYSLTLSLLFRGKGLSIPKCRLCLIMIGFYFYLKIQKFYFLNKLFFLKVVGYFFWQKQPRLIVGLDSSLDFNNLDSIQKKIYRIYFFDVLEIQAYL